MTSTAAAPPLWQDILLMIVALSFVLALIWYGLRYVLPRLQKLPLQSNSPLRVQARCPLEPRKTIYIVEAGSQVFLVGASESGLNLLSTLDGHDPALKQSPPTSTPLKFAEIFRRRAS